MVSSLFQVVIGFTGLIGFLLRFIGPLTIAPTITLVGVALFHVAAEHAGKCESLSPGNKGHCSFRGGEEGWVQRNYTNIVMLITLEPKK